MSVLSFTLQKLHSMGNLGTFSQHRFFIGDYDLSHESVYFELAVMSCCDLCEKLP